jgi:uncharacterized membrane protein
MQIIIGYKSDGSNIKEDLCVLRKLKTSYNFFYSEELPLTELRRVADCEETHPELMKGREHVSFNSNLQIPSFFSSHIGRDCFASVKKLIDMILPGATAVRSPIEANREQKKANPFCLL